MSVVERWSLPSGRVGTIDLDQDPGAVEVLRESLRDAGATLIADEGPSTVRTTEGIRMPVQAFAADGYDGARAERAAKGSALEAGGHQPEGETKKPGEDSVESKATRHARAAKAPRGTIAADRRIVVEDVPSDTATVHEQAIVEASTPRDVVRAEDQFTHLPIRIRRTSAGARVRVWRSGDGSWWRHGGFVRIRAVGDAERAFVVTLYKGANEADLTFLLHLVEGARRGRGFGSVWCPVDAEWADELTFSTADASRPYADPYTHFDSSEDVRPCDDDLCSLLWHTESDDHELDSIAKRLGDGGGGYEIRVERPQDAEQWRVRVNADWFDGTPNDVAGFVSDLQWMQAACERANKERVA